jgi:predicted alpha-1,6-mannanase (GH76 family)
VQLEAPFADVWAQRADRAQQALIEHYWNEGNRLFNNQVPCSGEACEKPFHYWWQAHAADVLVDGLIRTRASEYEERLSDLFAGILQRNGGDLHNDFYDDMEWLALAALRAFAATGVESYRQYTLRLWDEIRRGWNDEQGGGIAWKKGQPTYKNTPSNAPAAILAARLYREFGRKSDLDWAYRIYKWQMQNLVDPETGFVWDGKNRNGDGGIDKDWEFTYCQGVVVGAAVELYRVTGQASYLQQARRTADAAAHRLLGENSTFTRDETNSDAEGDGGLFKGIYARYLTELVLEDPSDQATLDFMRVNGERLWTRGSDSVRTLFGHTWTKPPHGNVSLSVQLSGVMLTEQMARLEQWAISERPEG